MAKLLTTRGIADKLERIIIDAKKMIIIASPYLKIPKIYLDRLQDADRKSIQILFIFGKTDLQPGEKEKLLKFKNLHLYFLEELHAKCFANESTAIIGSMNLYDFSENNNREMGIIVDTIRDHDIYDGAIAELHSIMKASTEISLSSFWNNPDKETKKAEKRVSYRNYNQQGLCIRCGTDIPLDPRRPYCDDCFKSWVYYSDPSFTEKHCHICGTFEESSMDKPLCYNCYKDHSM